MKRASRLGWPVEGLVGIEGIVGWWMVESLGRLMGGLGCMVNVETEVFCGGYVFEEWDCCGRVGEEEGGGFSFSP